MVPFSVTVHHGPFLLLVATGDAVVCEVRGMVDMAASIVEERGYQRVLFDSIAATLHLTSDEAARLGEHVAARLAGVERVASVVPERSPGHVGERNAQEAGLNIRTFVDLKAAFDWLDASSQA